MKTLVLNSSNKSIEIKLESPVSVELDFTAHYADSGNSFTESSCDGVTSGTSAATVVTSPASGTRVIKTITVHNPNTGSATFFLGLKNGSDSRTICKTTLGSHETWTTDGSYDSDGKLKVTGGGTVVTSVESADLASFVANGYIEKDLSSWGLYKNTAGTSPVDGVTGSPSAGFTLTRNTVNPLFGSGDALITKSAANHQGEGISTDFSIDNGLKGRTLEISFDYKTSSDYSTGDLGVYVYDKTNSQVIYPNVVDVPACTASTTFRAKFNTVTNSGSYRLVLHVKTTDAVKSWTVNFDRVRVSEEKTLQTGAMSDWVSWTPTGSWTTNTTYTGKWRRVGDSAEVQVRISLSGTPGGSSNLLIYPPFQIDSSKITMADQAIGCGHSVQNGQVVHLHSVHIGTNGIYLLVENNGNSLSSTNPQALGNNGFVSCEFTIPISGWSSNINLVQSSTEYAYNTSSTNTDDAVAFGYGPEGSAGIMNVTNLTAQRKKRVRFKTPIQVTDKIEVEIFDGSGWIPQQSAAVYSESGGGRCVIPELTPVTTLSTTTNCGMGLQVINQTDVDVIFGMYSVADYAGGCGGWMSFPTGIKWRVCKSSGSAVGEIAPVVYAEYYDTVGKTYPETPNPWIYTSKIEDTHGAYNSTTGIFTAPISGLYEVNGMATPNGSYNAYVYLFKNGSNLKRIGQNNGSSGTNFVGKVRLNAGDTIFVTGGTYTSASGGNHNNLSITRIGS